MPKPLELKAIDDDSIPMQGIAADLVKNLTFGVKKNYFLNNNLDIALVAIPLQLPTRCFFQ